MKDDATAPGPGESRFELHDRRSNTMPTSESQTSFLTPPSRQCHAEKESATQWPCGERVPCRRRRTMVTASGTLTAQVIFRFSCFFFWGGGVTFARQCCVWLERQFSTERNWRRWEKKTKKDGRKRTALRHREKKNPVTLDKKPVKPHKVSRGEERLIENGGRKLVDYWTAGSATRKWGHESDNKNIVAGWRPGVTHQTCLFGQYGEV